MLDTNTKHVIQLKLSYHRKGTIIINYNGGDGYYYAPSDNKLHKHKFTDYKGVVLNKDNDISILELLGDYDNINSNNEGTFHLAKENLFHIDYMYEIGDFGFNENNYDIVRLLDDFILEDESILNTKGNVSGIYDDVYDEIENIIENNPTIDTLAMDKLIIIEKSEQSNNYFDDCDFVMDLKYIGLFKLKI